MKLFRHGRPGEEHPGMLDAQGTLRDLTTVVADIDGSTLRADTLERLRQLDPSRLPALPPDTRLGPCVTHVGNFIGLGLNFADHAAEAKLPIPEYPLIFNKATSCLAGANDALPLPPGSREVDYEVEMAVVLRRAAWQVSEQDALDYVGGYCLSNDMTDRYWQSHYAGQWTIGKSAPGFGPLGPWLVTPDEVPDPTDILLELHVNGQRRQHANTAGMIFKVPHVIAYLSRFLRLCVGDVITLGTPAGVGLATGTYLKAGDEIVATGGVLGAQHIRIQDGPSDRTGH